jgi:hypothetical protein
LRLNNTKENWISNRLPNSKIVGLGFRWVLGSIFNPIPVNWKGNGMIPIIPFPQKKLNKNPPPKKRKKKTTQNTHIRPTW